MMKYFLFFLIFSFEFFLPAKSTVEILDLGGGLTAVRFDPKINHLCLASRTGGARVSELTQEINGIAGLNGGLFTYGPNQNFGSWNWYYSKAKQRLGLRNAAFPSAILKVGSKLLSDTQYPSPAIGWTKDGSRIEIGNVKINWQAKTDHFAKAIPLIRVTSLNSDSDSVIYFHPDQTSALRAVVVRHNTVRSIYSVHEIDQNHPNSYVLQASLNETYVHELTQLKINHSLMLSYHFLNESSEEDRRFSGLDDVISGREILIKNGQIQQANWERPADGWSAICIDSNNKLSLAVYFPVRTELPVSEELCYLAPDFLEDNSYCRWGEKTYNSYFAQLLKDKLSCQQAIYLDAGASTTLVTFDHSGNSQIIGKNIVVSDALVVMP